MAPCSHGQARANRGPLPAAVQVIYRIYRRDEASGKDAIAGEVPLGEPGVTHFTDSSFEWERVYLYRLTTVTILKRSDSELQVEGEDTAPVRIVAHDVFPPAVPRDYRRPTRVKDRNRLSISSGRQSPTPISRDTTFIAAIIKAKLTAQPRADGQAECRTSQVAVVSR